MYGVIIGDIVGSVYEWNNIKTKVFPLFHRCCGFTDDSVMTIAVAEALLDSWGQPEAARRKALTDSLQKWGRRYPEAGYGRKFTQWIFSQNPEPYRSWGNGSAMRVSAAGWLYDTLEETQQVAKETAEVTHNHPEGIKGAVATASVIWMARNGCDKKEIRKYVETDFYPLEKTCDQIREVYQYDGSCQGTVPQAITAFLEGNDFEDVIRTAVSLGGDCDTLTCIAGGMAEAFYGVPEELKQECRKRITPDIQAVLDAFEEKRKVIIQK